MKLIPIAVFICALVGNTLASFGCSSDADPWGTYLKADLQALQQRLSTTFAQHDLPAGGYGVPDFFGTVNVSNLLFSCLPFNIISHFIQLCISDKSLRIRNRSDRVSNAESAVRIQYIFDNCCSGSFR